MLAVELVSITIILIVHINNVRIRNYLNVCRGYICCVAKSTNFRDATTGWHTIHARLVTSQLAHNTLRRYLYHDKIYTP